MEKQQIDLPEQSLGGKRRPRVPDFRIAKRTDRLSFLWFALSVLAHVVLVARLAIPLERPSDQAVFVGLQQFVQLDPSLVQRTVQFTELAPSASPPAPSGSRDPRMERPLVGVASPATIAGQSAGQRRVPVAFVDGGAGLPLTYDVAPGAIASSAVPGFGTGVLWEGIDVSTASEGQIIAGLAQLGMLDSTLLKNIRTFLDTVPADSFAFGQMPSWLIDVNGEKWGIDGAFIHLGPVKIPTFLLALLPLPEAGDYERSQNAAALEQMRQEVIRQARMMETREEIRNYIKATRERMEEERRRRLEEEGNEPEPVAPVPQDTVVS